MLSRQKYVYSVEPPLAGGRRALASLIPARRGWRAFAYARALLALKEVFARRLQGGGVVTVLTASGGRYVSSCVTRAARQCGGKVSRVMEDNTRVVVAIHEWGALCGGLAAIKKSRPHVALIEDYAYATGLFFLSPAAPVFGDYVLLSPRKFFGGALPGVLLARRGDACGGEALAANVHFVLSPSAIARARARVWRRHAKALGLPLARLEARGLKGDYAVFVCPCLPAHEPLRLRLRQKGVEAIYWYGNRRLLLPAHHGIGLEDSRRICALVKKECAAIGAPPLAKVL